MADREKKHITGLDEEQYKQWRELSKEHWGHWRAWGSWFSWGSPVGLGLFSSFSLSPLPSSSSH